MAIVKFKTTHTTLTTLTTLVIPQRGDNIDNFLLGRGPMTVVKVVKVVWVVLNLTVPMVLGCQESGQYIC